jgi:hypothetical protein
MTKKPKVYNKYHGDAPADAVNIMRPNIFGNNFSHMEFAKHHDAMTWVPTREEAVERFRERVEGDEIFKRMIKRHLKGKDLVCCCKPLPCHGDVLLEIANDG